MDTVLFVDDEVSILNSLKRGLIDEEYDCAFAANAMVALDIMEKQKISVICTDMRMPGMDGLALLKIVKEKYPRTVRVVLSGYTQLQQILATINQADIFKFVTKPWKLESEFKAVIQQSLEYYRIQTMNEELRKSLEHKNQAYQNILKRIDEVIANAKNEVLLIKDAGFNSISYICGLFDNTVSQETINSLVRMLSAIYENTMKIAVMDFKDTNLKEQIDQFSMRLNYKKQIARVDLTNNLGSGSISLKPDILPYMLSIIEGGFLSEDNRYYIKIICDSHANGGGEAVELTFLISQSLDDKQAAFGDYTFIDENIKLFNLPVNDIIKCCGSAISCVRKDANIIIKVILHNHI